MLVQNGLLEYEKDIQTFKTTNKCHKFVKVYNQIGKSL
ncbi:hypothetical protein Ngar_c25760 [Candidatus Nitrososphaera gargensis Ga9.2]|uniref:Uncharacterized protein n=1 Tax=Nitrososphaera gargensis (strain Ga9.2) TaxID=1237085 RepID=K0ILI3_NITGG|nr:hypothetical protein [Candidatus Nitrososphaera gargensis]AFU59497.1 hypothetical protein Ngar_c25760 [Candidatus Nitrososphaera gargensis Ga9.2]